jgi:hypothetical protein
MKVMRALRRERTALTVDLVRTTVNGP